jgi:hypothetical protein
METTNACSLVLEVAGHSGSKLESEVKWQREREKREHNPKVQKLEVK